jgi:hypothetical protein
VGDIVNLRAARKSKARADAAKTAEGNRARFGRTKAEKQRDSGNKELARSFLDGHRRDRSDGK